MILIDLVLGSVSSTAKVLLRCFGVRGLVGDRSPRCLEMVSPISVGCANTQEANSAIMLTLAKNLIFEICGLSYRAASSRALVLAVFSLKVGNIHSTPIPMVFVAGKRTTPVTERDVSQEEQT